MIEKELKIQKQRKEMYQGFKNKVMEQMAEKKNLKCDEEKK
jgi:hypothetical protein